MDDPSPYRIASDKLGFYIAANDHEILAQVNRLMTRSGYVGMMDTAGRLQYLVDGRRGSPHAARRIVETTGRLLRDREEAANPLLHYLALAADQVLAAYGILQNLKGYRYLRYLLLLAGLDDGRLRPVSKTLYPAAASHFRVTVTQVERDIRYACRRSEMHQLGLTNTLAICRLYDEMIRQAEALRNKEMPSGTVKDAEGMQGTVFEATPENNPPVAD